MVKTGVSDVNQAFKYTIGTNAAENWEILKTAQFLMRTNPDSAYFWFHVDGYSSAYVILETPHNAILNDTECKKIVYEMAVLCKQRSKARHELGQVRVVYCPVDNLRCGITVGEVIIKSTSKCKYVSV